MGEDGGAAVTVTAACGLRSSLTVAPVRDRVCLGVFVSLEPHTVISLPSPLILLYGAK